MTLEELIKKKGITERDPKNCKSSERCSAPLCPLDAVSLENGIWYPDEEICVNREFNSLDAIKNQKKIAKRAKSSSTLFTFKMLSRNCVIGSGISGIDSDKDDCVEQEKQWIRKHHEKKKLTAEERAKLAERMKKNIATVRDKQRKK